MVRVNWLTPKQRQDYVEALVDALLAYVEADKVRHEITGVREGWERIVEERMREARAKALRVLT